MRNLFQFSEAIAILSEQRSAGSNLQVNICIWKIDHDAFLISIANSIKNPWGS
jgi:hypothetical protein